MEEDRPWKFERDHQKVGQSFEDYFTRSLFWNFVEVQDFLLFVFLQFVQFKCSGLRFFVYDLFII